MSEHSAEQDAGQIERMRTALWNGLDGQRKAHPSLIDKFERAVRADERRVIASGEGGAS